jgi:hypothetical protein
MAGAAGTDHKVGAHENNSGTEFGAEKIGKTFNKDDGRDENLAAYVFGIDDLRLQPYQLPPVGQALSLSPISLFPCCQSLATNCWKIVDTIPGEH